MHFLPSQSTLTFPSYPLPFSEISFIDFHFLAEGHIKGPTGLQVLPFDHGKSLLIPKRPFVYFWDSYDFGRYRDLKMNGENLAKHVLHFRFWYSGVQKSYSWIFASSPGSFEYRINFSFIHCRPLASQCFEQNPSLSLLSFPMSLIWQIPRTTSPISSSASSWGSYDWLIYFLQPEVLPLHLKWSNQFRTSNNKIFPILQNEKYTIFPSNLLCPHLQSWCHLPARCSKFTLSGK